MGAVARLHVGELHHGLGEIDHDPDIRRIAAARGQSTQAAAALHDEAEAVQPFAFRRGANRAAIVAVDAVAGPGAAAVARAPQLDFGDASRADRVNLVLQVERARADHSRPLAWRQDRTDR